MLKAVISGRGEETVNLAKTYLWCPGGLAMVARLVRISESRRVSPATCP